MAKNNFGGNLFFLMLAVIAILLVFLALGQSLQSDLPKLTRFGTEETRLLTSFPTFFPEGEYLCYPTVGKHIFFQNLGGKKEICQRGERINIERSYQTYVWYR